MEQAYTTDRQAATNQPGVGGERLVYLRGTGASQSASVPLATYRKEEPQTTLYHSRIADGLSPLPYTH